VATALQGFRLSPQQRRAFLLQPQDGRSWRALCAVRLEGPLARDVLRRALERAVARHQILRTLFHRAPGVTLPLQVIAEEAEVAWQVSDLTARPEEERALDLDALFDAEGALAHDPERGPTVRAHLLALAPALHVLLLSLPAGCADEATLRNLVLALGCAYQAGGEDAGEEPIQYVQLSEWMNELLEDGEDPEGREFWRRQDLSALRAEPFPWEAPRGSSAADGAGLASIPIALPAELAREVEAAACAQGVTTAAFFLAAWQALQFRFSGYGDNLTAVLYDGRPYAELADALGLFARWLPVRSRCADELAFADLLLEAERRTGEAALWQDHFRWQGLGDGEGAAEWRTGFEFLPEPPPAASFDGVRFALARASAPFDRVGLRLSCARGDDGLTACLRFESHAVRRPVVERMASHLPVLLASAARAPRTPVGELELLPPGERRRLLADFNQTAAPFPADRCLHEMVREQARLHPEAPALLWRGEAVSYGELAARSTRLAQRLRRLGTRPDIAIGIFLERSPDMVVAALAVLEAGSAYLPLELSYPKARLAAILEESRAPAVLTRSGLADELPAGAARRVLLDRDEPAAGDAGEAGRAACPDDLAYVLYTSGSTGKPKGVMVSHRAVVNYLAWSTATYRMTSGRGALLHSPLSFDLSVTSLWGPLVSGRAVALVAEEDGLEGLCAALADGGFSLIKITPAHLSALSHLLPPEHAANAGALIVGGEALASESLELWRLHAPATRVVNEYGPTEATVGCCVHEFAAGAPLAGPVPIGRPIANARIYVAGRALQPAPVGVPGELLIGGDGLARGYLGHPELTAERFIPDPFGHEPGARLYRTGDLARHRADGELEFLGRLDHQVKIRSYRIELDEVAAVLAQHPKVQDAVAVVHPDERGEPRLLGYWTAAGTPAPDAEELRTFLAERLPEPMVPVALVALPALPLTANGKVDRAALPAPDVAGRGAARFVAPRDAVEEVLAEIWAGVLGAERVGAEDSFFDLGGHSLLAAQLLSRIRQALHVEVSLRELFAAPTIGALSRLVAAHRQSGEAERRLLPPIVRVPRDAALPLSFAQQRLWFLDRFQPGSSAYNLPVGIRARGPLEVAALARTRNEILRRHEVLRTIFAVREGVPVQVVAEYRPQPLPLIDLGSLPEPQREREARRLADAEAELPFDLAAGPPSRASLLRLAPDDHVALLTQHHIVSDGWSQQLLIGEVVAIYRAFLAGEASPLPTLPIQYADFAHWQRHYLTGEMLEPQLAYWRRRLAGAPPLELPADRPRPAVQSFRGRVQGFALPASPLPALIALGRRRGATLFMLLLAVFKALLHRYTQQTDLVMGTPVANRARVEIESLIGFFVNTVVLRTEVDGLESFTDLLERVRDGALAAFSHQDLPFEHLVDVLQPQRDTSHQPIFQVVFMLETWGGAALELPGLDLSAFEAEGTTAKFDLTLLLQQTPSGLRGACEYNTDLFDRSTIERLTGHLRRLLEAVADGPERPFGELPLLSAAERRQMVAEWNDTDAETSAGPTIHALFEERAARDPAAPAVLFHAASVSYSELDRRAGHLALLLQWLGIGPGSYVGVYLSRSDAMVTAVLGVLKAGAAYVPLEASFPAQRLCWILSALEISCVITEPSRLDLLAGLAAEAPALRDLVLTTGREPADREGLQVWSLPEFEPPAPACLPEVSGDDAAYVIFTSGSTGVPKGVLVRHRAAVNLIDWVTRRFAFGPSDRVLFVTALGFDLSVFDLFGLLAAGGSIRVASESDLQDPERLVQMLRGDGITFWDSAPAALQQLAPFLPVADAGELRLVFLSGDWIPLWLPDGMRRAFPNAQVVSLGGATEATVWSNYFPVAEVPPHWVSIPYGRPIQNARYHVLDGFLDPCPIGVAGDLHIAGGCLASEYAREPALTAERFLPDRFASQPGARMYATGDRARYWPDGNLEFLGRLDHQVKIRGFRIELGEISTVLGQHAGVRDCAAVVREDTPGDRRLVAYFVPDPDAAPSEPALREFARERLPEYMVPAAFVALPALPVTANGKLDRQALPRPERVPGLDDAFLPQRSPIEELLAAIWADVLGVERVAARDDFFELGGHSLLATQVISRLREAFRIDLPLRVLFEAPTLAALAERVGEARHAEHGVQPPPLRPIPRTGALPLSFAQQRFWFLQQLEPGNTAYNMPAAARLEGRLEAGILARALAEIVRRHESLRTIFTLVDGVPAQSVAPPSPLPLRQVDLSALGAAHRAAESRRLAAAEAHWCFALDRGPLVRVLLVRLAEREHLVLATMHHIVSDGWSMELFLREVAVLYGALAAGRPSPLPDLPLQYADFAAWQRQWLQGEVLAAELAYWRQLLEGAPSLLELPTDRPRPPVQGTAGAHWSFTLPRALSDALIGLGRRQGATPFMTLLSGFLTLLSHTTQQPDLCVGSPIAGRNHLETEALIGFFVNTLVLRANLAGDPSFQRLVEQVRGVALDAHAHQELPFEKLVEELRPERSLAQTPLFQVLFVLQNIPQQQVGLPELRLTGLDADLGRALFDLALSMRESERGFVATFEYRTDLFDLTTVARMAGHLEVLLAAAAADPSRSVAELPMLTRPELHQILVEWDARETTAAPAGLHELFTRQAAAAPVGVALRYAGAALTYGELDAQSNRVAHALRELGAAAGEAIAVLAQEGRWQVTALLGVLKAGCPFVCLDPNYPAPRLAQVLAEAAPRLVVADEAGVKRSPLAAVEAARRLPLLILDAPAAVAPTGWEGACRGTDLLNRCPSTAPAIRVEPEAAAYIVYTSGSTGRPKGIVQSHRSFCQFLAWQSRAFGIGPGQRVALWAAITYDAAYCEIFGCLCFGATLCLADESVRYEPRRLARWLRDEEVALFQTVPTFFRELLGALDPSDSDPLPALDFVLLAGEVLPPELAAVFRGRFGDRPRLFNLYGPSEAVLATWCPVDEEPGGRAVVPIGRAIDGRQVLVLDPLGQPCPVGVPGEIHLRSRYLTAGYFRRPDETARSFVPDPLATAWPDPIYRTGDLGRWRADGRLEFRGRRDQQVKLRGMRVELGEIEGALTRHPAVAESAVLLVDAEGDQLLVACFVAHRAASPPAAGDGPPHHAELLVSELRAFLRHLLPEHMVPVDWVELESLPRTRTGKLDRKALAGRAAAFRRHPAAAEAVREVLAGHPAVAECMVVPRSSGGAESQLVAYVVAAAEVSGGDAESAHVESYRQIYDAVYGQRLTYSAALDGLNRRIWIDSYTDEPFSDEEIAEGVEDMVGRIQALRPRRLLEIGCGSGLLLLRVTPGCSRYVGTDIALEGLRYLEKDLRDRLPVLPEGLKLLHCAAHEFEGLEGERFDTVVLNDVVIYFPTAEYLLDVLTKALRLLEPGGSVFLGGLRSLPLQRAFHTSVVLHQAPATAPARELRRRARQRLAAEKELVFDPRWFLGLPRLLPEIGGVRIEIKGGRLDNEVTRFQYDVTLRIGKGEASPPPPQWLDWSDDGLSFDTLERLLTAETRQGIAITGVPNARLAGPARSLELLAHAGDDARAGELQQALARDPGPGGVIPDDLRDLASRLRYDLNLAWVEAAEDGRFQAFFRPLEDTALTTPTADPVKAGAPEHEPAPLANRPARALYEQRLAARLHCHLADHLPSRRLPVALCFVDRLPALAGEVTSVALPDGPLWPETETLRETPLEACIGAIWRELLNVAWVGPEQNFFDLGGHSLLATQVINRLREARGVDLSLRDFFATPTIAGLARRIEAADEVAAPVLARLPRTGGRMPASFAQQRLWFQHQVEAGHAYNMASALRVVGRLDTATLERSFREVLRRHETLRTAFSLDEAGEVVQLMLPAVPFGLSHVDLTALPQSARQSVAEALTASEGVTPFDLARAPLLRATLLRLAEEEHVLLLTMHHIVSDAWSLGVLVREVTGMYQAFTAGAPSPLPELAIQYADYAHWQRQWLTGERLESSLGFWRRNLAGAPRSVPLSFRRRAGAQSARGAAESFTLPPATAKGVRALGRREEATLFMTLLAALDVLLYAHSGATDMVVGTDVSGRDRAETEGLIGFFVNLLPLRADLSGNPTFRELLQRVRDGALAASAHQHVPFDRLVSELRPERTAGPSPLFDVLFVMQNTPAGEVSLPGLRFETFGRGPGVSRFDLALFASEVAGAIRGTWLYRSDLFASSDVAGMCRDLSRLLKRIADEPDARLDSLRRVILAERAERTRPMDEEQKAKSFEKFKQVRPKAMSLSPAAQVAVEPLSPDRDLLALFRPDGADVDLAAWAAANRGLVEERLLRHGAVLFRGFGIRSVAEFESLALAVCPQLHGEYGDLPREGQGQKVYRSTPYPADKTILFHNESSHLPSWPLRQFFFCLKASATGGETPLVDCREIYRRLDPELRRHFAERGLLYVRNFTEGVDVSWCDFFRTDDRQAVEEHCRRNGIGFQWKDGLGLRIWQQAPAVARHPQTGETVFFNQIQLHHVACLDREVRSSLEALFAPDDLPRNVYYGDGTPIDDAVVERIAELYWDASVQFPWQEGDVLALDNMLVAHARNPFVGERKIVVAMGQMSEATALR
jgi:amino acid adenylation domain-containing protein